ncbi:MAG: hypothetical protein EU533_04695 [Promethearchaeota archaeon]|nr:MAG: hypothetical protein EU533_04695 [Candidatus Lokiarchaeota archaeon]
MPNSGDIPIKIELFGIGSINAIIYRHLAPLSADAILDKMPFIIRGRFNFGQKDYWSLPGIEIYKGLNPKSTRSANKGDIVYNPKSDELIILLEDREMQNKVNIIGKINENLNLFLKARSGLNTKFVRTRKNR